MFIWGGRAPAVDGNFNSMQWYSLTYQDYLDISTDCPDVKLATPVIQRGDIRAVSDFFQTSGQLMGVKDDFNDIRYTPIADGRWLNTMDDAQKRAVVVIGDEARKVLFPGRPSLGSTILLNGIRFQIVGTLARLGHGDNNNANLRMMIPFNTMKMYFPPTGNQNRVDRVSFINYQPRSRALHETAKEEVHRIISRNHGGFNYKDPDAFDEWDTIRTVDQVGKIFDAMNLFLGSVGLVTLALGAIGIINIMLVAVADRTREIGLRKALGATNRSIMFQFFTEGAFLTLMSGGLGMAGAAALMAALAKLPQPPGFDTPRLVPMTAALAIISLAFAGVLAGVYPARKAALLQPVEALRKE
jgi:putative ABC transport system permease protein